MIALLAGQGHSAKACCRMLGVAPSGFFYWRTRPPSARELRSEHFGGLISDIYRVSNGTYGTRRVAAELRFGYELTVNRKAVRRVMRHLGLEGLPVLKPKRRGPDTEGAAADDLVLRLLNAKHQTGCGSPTSPSTQPGRASSTAASSWTHIPVVSLAGQSISSKQRHSSRARWVWRSTRVSLQTARLSRIIGIPQM